MKWKKWSPHFFHFSCLFRTFASEMNVKRINTRLKKMKKQVRSGCFPQIFTNFAKNTAHNERRLRKNAYLCIVAENPLQT